MSRFPPSQRFSVENAIERSYDLAIHSLRSEMQALEISQRIADKWNDLKASPWFWQRTPQNPATKTDLATYKLMESYKKKWAGDERSKIPVEIADRWVLEGLVEYALKHQPMYMGVTVGNVLFTYQNTQVQRVLERLDPKLVFTDADRKDADFRRARKFIINNLKTDNGNAKRIAWKFLILKETTHKNEPKRFKAREYSVENFKFVDETLSHLTPLDPICPFPDTFYAGKLNVYETPLESYIAPGLSDEAKELVRKHILLDPRCWAPIYEQLGFGSPERKLEMPDYSSNPRITSINNTPPQGPTPMPQSPMKLSPQLRDEIANKAKDSNKKRKTFVAASVEIAVTDENRVSIPVNGSERRSQRLELEDGDSFIELEGINESGSSMLLRTIFVSWDENEIPPRPVRHITKLADGGKIKLIITYHRDKESNVPISATADVTYIPKRNFLPLPVYSVLKWITAGFLLAVGVGLFRLSGDKPSSNPPPVVDTTSPAASNSEATRTVSTSYSSPSQEDRTNKAKWKNNEPRAKREQLLFRNHVMVSLLMQSRIAMALCQALKRPSLTTPSRERHA
jgi:hypothetical protein